MLISCRSSRNVVRQVISGQLLVLLLVSRTEFMATFADLSSANLSRAIDDRPAHTAGGHLSH